jgi:hypothetical protein
MARVYEAANVHTGQSEPIISRLGPKDSDHSEGNHDAAMHRIINPSVFALVINSKVLMSINAHHSSPIL